MIFRGGGVYVQKKGCINLLRSERPFLSVREENIKAVGKNIAWKKGKGKQSSLPAYIVRLVGKRGRNPEYLGKNKL